MATRLYLNTDLAGMAGKFAQNLQRDIGLPVADFVAGDGNGRRFSYTESTARAWCEAHGFTFAPLPDVTPTWQT